MKTIIPTAIAVMIIAMMGAYLVLAPRTIDDTEWEAWKFQQEYVSQDQCFYTCLDLAFEEDGRTEIFDPCVCHLSCTPNALHPVDCYEEGQAPTLEEYKRMSPPPL